MLWEEQESQRVLSARLPSPCPGRSKRYRAALTDCTDTKMSGFSISSATLPQLQWAEQSENPEGSNAQQPPAQTRGSACPCGCPVPSFCLEGERRDESGRFPQDLFRFWCFAWDFSTFLDSALPAPVSFLHLTPVQLNRTTYWADNRARSSWNFSRHLGIRLPPNCKGIWVPNSLRHPAKP